MDPFPAMAVVLFILGAVASGYCLGRLLGRPSGFAVALFYLTVLLYVTTENDSTVLARQVMIWRARLLCLRNALDAG
jgi:hypothetical protein